MTNKNSPVEVFAGTSWQTALVQSLLKDSEIGSFTKDTVMGVMFPWYADGGGAGGVKVFVSPENEAEALVIVEEYLKNVASLEDEEE